MGETISSQGLFVILSGPSGVGKTLFLQKSLKEFSWLCSTVSWTTRPPRKGEKEGEFYHFSTKKDFYRRRDQGEFLEWAEVHGEFYATSKKEVESLWQKGQVIIKDVDVQGGLAIKKIFPHSVSIFIYPPSLHELEKRILKRGSNTKEQMKKRLANSALEMAQGRKYDYKIVNDSFPSAWAEFQKILSEKIKKT